MKKYFLLIVMLAIYLPSIHAYSQSDTSCLKLERSECTPYFNPDSVMIDSCINSPYYLQHYAKKYFLGNSLRFNFTTWDVFVIKRVDYWWWNRDDTTYVYKWQDVNDEKYSAEKTGLKKLEEKFGTFKILVSTENDSYKDDDDYLSNDHYLLLFDNYVNIDSVVAQMKKIPNIDTSHVYYMKRDVHVAGVEDAVNDNECTVYPQPATDYINIKFPASKAFTSIAELYTPEGILLESIELPIGSNSTQIDITKLSSGIYYLRINNTVKSFVVVK